MSDNGTRRMIERYTDDAPASLYLASKFRTPPENFHDSEFVEIDIERDSEDVAVVVKDLSVEGRGNESSIYTNKEWTPPIYKEKATVNAFKLLKRMPGSTAYDSPVYKANALNAVMGEVRKIEKKIQRAIELQASQTLQTGTLTLKNSDGVNMYSLDFQPKSSHIVTVGNDWGGGSETPLADIEALSVVVKRDGKQRPNELTFGRLAWQDFLADSDVQTRLNFRRADLAVVSPSRSERNAMFQGRITVGNYEFEMFTYDATYDDVETGTSTPYVTDDLVIMTSSESRFDLTYGGIPLIGDPDPMAMQFVPRRISNGGNGIDLFVNAWTAKDRSSITVEVSARPLTIPTAIDTIGVLNTRA